MWKSRGTFADSKNASLILFCPCNMYDLLARSDRYKCISDLYLFLTDCCKNLS